MGSAQSVQVLIFANASAIFSIRFSSKSFRQSPSFLKYDPTIMALEQRANLSTFSLVTPDPTMTGSSTAPATSSTSPASASDPVAAPVTMTPSAPKNCAALAVSYTSTSAVSA